MEDGLTGKGFTVQEDVLFHQIEDEIVVLDLKSQQYYALDSVGARIWQLLADHGSPELVADLICEEYAADRQQVLRDVESMIGDFRAAGLVKERTL